VSTRTSGNRKFVDSPLEGRVTSELVSEVDSGVRKKSDFQRFLDDSGLVKRGFARKINAERWTSSGMAAGKMDLFSQAVGLLSDWYYAYFLNARLAAAAHFPVP